MASRVVLSDVIFFIAYSNLLFHGNRAYCRLVFVVNCWIKCTVVSHLDLQFDFCSTCCHSALVLERLWLETCLSPSHVAWLQVNWFHRSGGHTYQYVSGHECLHNCKGQILLFVCLFNSTSTSIWHCLLLQKNWGLWGLISFFFKVDGNMRFLAVHPIAGSSTPDIVLHSPPVAWGGSWKKGKPRALR